MNILGKAGFAAVLLATSSIASAQWYVGGSGGRSSTGFNTPDFTVGTTEIQKKNKSAYKLFVGRDFSRNWAVEGGYAALGTPQYQFRPAVPPDVDWDMKESALFLAAKGTLPVSDRFNLFGKLGWTRNKVQMHIDALSLDRSKSRSNTLIGMGAEFAAARNFAVRLEYEDFGKFGSQIDALTGEGTGATRTGFWSLGAAFKF